MVLMTTTVGGKQRQQWEWCEDGAVEKKKGKSRNFTQQL
jgi:hypothetical protein